MKEEYKDFVGIYDGSVPVELCNNFANSFDDAEKARTVIPPAKVSDGMTHRDRSISFSAVSSDIYPLPPVQEYWKYLQSCFYAYDKRYNIAFTGALYNDTFKIHKVRKEEGYHVWHYENGNGKVMDRLLTYMTYIRAPKKGGETEFLHQSLRIEPIVGRTLIWPAGFTHKHRGNPPLDGDKIYITGWFCGANYMEDIPGK